jgi:uncharacterized radical SAM superfamily protein
MNWLARLQVIEELEDADFDAALVARLETAHHIERPLRFATPTFKAYGSSELAGCGRMSFPAFSVTGGACALDCEHCHARILTPMLPALSPGELDQRVRDLIARQDLRGFLLSGGSNRRNEIRYERYFPVIEGLKRDFPHLRIAVHTALIDGRRARALAAAGFDTAMLDIIGSNDTIREVYHLERDVEEFEAALAALCNTTLEVVPHIVIGLHFGSLRGEARALDIIARHAVQALVLVVIMPQFGTAGRFATPRPQDIGAIFLDARERLPDKEVLLGCARPGGMHKRVTDAYAVMAGLDGIAFPADGTVAVATALGRPCAQEHACCSLRLTPRARAMMHT